MALPLPTEPKDPLRLSLEGKTVCFCGTLFLLRADATTLAEDLGATVVKQLTKKVNVIVGGPTRSNAMKVRRAQQRGCEFWTEDEFAAFLDHQQQPKVQQSVDDEDEVVVLSDGEGETPAQHSWLEECSNDQLKEICRSAKLSVSGNKNALSQRLMGDDFVAAFCSQNNVLVALDLLKKECRKRFLQLGGTRLDLLLRLLRDEKKGTAASSASSKTKKRALGKINTTSGQQAPPRATKKRKPNKPSPKSYYSRVKTKINRWEKGTTYNNHGRRVEALIAELMQALLDESDAQLVCECYHAIISSCVDHFEAFEETIGYCDDLEGMAQRIADHVASIRSEITMQALEDLAVVLTKWHKLCRAYGLFDNFRMEDVTDKIRGKDAKQAAK